MDHPAPHQPPPIGPNSPIQLGQQRKGGSWVPWVVGGCLMTTLIGITGLVLTVFYVVKNVRTLGGEMAHSTMVQQVQTAQMPAADRQQLIAALDKLHQRFQSGQITAEEGSLAMGELVISNVMEVGTIRWAEETYVDASGLSDDEKQAAHRALQRLARGMHEKKLAMGTSWQVFSHTTMNQGRLPATVSDETLLQIVAAAKKSADSVTVPDEDFVVDLGKTFEAAVEESIKSIRAGQTPKSFQQMTPPTMPISPSAPVAPAATEPADEAAGGQARQQDLTTPQPGGDMP